MADNATHPNTGLAPTFRMPLENEWSKAAYYSPNYGGAGVGSYYAFATQSNSAPAPRSAAVATIQFVVACSAIEGVPAIITREVIIARFPIQLVIPVAAVEVILANAPE